MNDPNDLPPDPIEADAVLFNTQEHRHCLNTSDFKISWLTLCLVFFAMLVPPLIPLCALCGTMLCRMTPLRVASESRFGRSRWWVIVASFLQTCSALGIVALSFEVASQERHGHLRTATEAAEAIGQRLVEPQLSHTGMRRHLDPHGSTLFYLILMHIFTSFLAATVASVHSRGLRSGYERLKVLQHGWLNSETIILSGERASWMNDPKIYHAYQRFKRSDPGERGQSLVDQPERPPASVILIVALASLLRAALVASSADGCWSGLGRDGGFRLDGVLDIEGGRPSMLHALLKHPSAAIHHILGFPARLVGEALGGNGTELAASWAQGRARTPILNDLIFST